MTDPTSKSCVRSAARIYNMIAPPVNNKLKPKANTPVISELPHDGQTKEQKILKAVPAMPQ